MTWRHRAGIVIRILGAAGLIAGCSAHAAQPMPAVTVTRTVGPHIKTRTVTRTVPGPTVTVTAPVGDSFACDYTAEGPDLSGAGTDLFRGACTMGALLPLYLGQILITAPNGTTATYEPVGG